MILVVIPVIPVIPGNRDTEVQLHTDCCSLEVTPLAFRRTRYYLSSDTESINF